MHRVLKQRIGSAALVLATVALTVVASAGEAYRVGSFVKADDPGLGFFANVWSPPSVDDACLSYVGEYAVRNSDPNDVLFLGDSACRFDVDSVAFSRATGLSSYNLGTFAEPAVLPVIAKTYLSKHPPPRAIYLLVATYSLGHAAELRVGTAPWRFSKTYGQANSANKQADFAYYTRRGVREILHDLATLGKQQRPDFRSLPLRGMASETYWTLQHNVQQARGHWGLPGEHSPRARPEATHGDAVYMSADWSAAIEAAIASSEECQIPLVLRISPISADMKGVFDFSPLEQRLRELSVRHPKLIVCQPTIDFYERPLCWDTIHLNAAGIARFMPVVVKDVQRALGSQTHSAVGLRPHESIR